MPNGWVNLASYNLSEVTESLTDSSSSNVFRKTRGTLFRPCIHLSACLTVWSKKTRRREMFLATTRQGGRKLILEQRKYVIRALYQEKKLLQEGRSKTCLVVTMTKRGLNSVRMKDTLRVT